MASKKAVKAAGAKTIKPKEVKQSIEMNAKMANPDKVLKKYDELIATLAEVESDQRNKKKPYRIYFIHRNRMEVMKMNFIKSMR